MAGLRFGVVAILLPVPAPTIAPARQVLYACHPQAVNGYDNDGNPHRHPQAQRDALRAVLE
jgi:hypothetical protein